MPTTITKTVKPTGGDYTSLSAWNAGEQRDLTSVDEIAEAACYNMSDTTQVSLDGWTTDATRYIRVYAVDIHSGSWTTSAYRLAIAAFSPFNLYEAYTRIEGIQLDAQGQTTYAPYGIRILSGATHCRIERNIIKNTYSGTNADGLNRGINCALSIGDPVYISNNIIYGFDEIEAVGNSTGIHTGNATAYVFNNTVYGCKRGITDDGGNTCRAINNICASNSIADFSSGMHADSNYNASSDATAIGANARTSQTFTFVSTTGGSEDFHLQSSDTGAKGYGTDLSGHVTYPISVDIDNVTRTGTWDIGADQTALTGNPWNYYAQL